MNQLFLLIRLLFFLLIFFVFPLHSYSQNVPIKPLPQVNKDFLVIVHIVLDKDSAAGVDPSILPALFAAINPYFAPIGVSFTVCEVRNVYNFQYNAVDTAHLHELFTTYRVPNRINVFLVDDFLGTIDNAAGIASLGGITSLNTPQGIALQKSTLNSGVLAHEMGHYFSLPHTFEGGGIELANGSNCTSEGDGVCDTPADPYVDPEKINGYVDANCIFISMKKDANGEYYDPNVSNIMNYYNCGCKEFTYQQYEKMANHYLSFPITW